MPDAPANAWTGQHLLWWLQAHPQWLDRPVHLMTMTNLEEDAYLTTAEEDRFDPGDPNVISLIAEGCEVPVALPALSPTVGREVLADLAHDAWHGDFAGAAGKHWLVADALLARYDIRERGETA